MKPTLYIPVETAARELDGKLLLSLFAVEKGFPVVLGNRALMSNALHGFEPGVFLSHNFDKGRRRILRIARDLGFTTVGWDEEGLVWVSPEIYRSRRVDAGAVETLGAIYAWGEEHAAALAPVTEPARVRVVKAGNPRADLLRPELRGLYEGPVGALRSELGRFILINSNFGWLNYALGSGSSDAGGDGLQELARRSGHPEEFLRFRLDVFEAFVKALPRLARTFADRTIVVRPHPSEDPAVWESAAAGLKNVVVRYDHELIPWLLAADVIVHNGCTTAVEAAALGRAPIAFCPVHGGPHEIPQPRAVSLVAEDEETLLDTSPRRPSRRRRRRRTSDG